MLRRSLLKSAVPSLAAGAAALASPLAANAAAAQSPAAGSAPSPFNIRNYGAKGDGATLDTAAINQAIQAAATAGGGTVHFPAGVYLTYSIHLQSNVGLYLDHGAVLLAAPSPMEGISAPGAYDLAEPQGAWEPYQDYGHNHWHNSLLWGEGLHDISITGSGLIWGKGLLRGWDWVKDPGKADASKPGVGNKSIALKNCRNVLLRDFSVLEGGHFCVLATGVDNLTIDNLLLDTNRDGMDIDCCRNVRVSNCTVNSPWDDGICPKSSFALGYARPTENLTITNCYVTGGYELGSVLDGSWKLSPDPHWPATGRIKLGTESNGGFRNITISNCVFESCQGFALESEDGALIEDIAFSNITMRDIRTAPLFLRLGTRMRGPKGVEPGVMRRVLLSNISSSGASHLPSILSGVPGHNIEDLKIHDVFLEQIGGAAESMAALDPPEKEAGYPDPRMFGDLPATGFFIRHVKNLEMSNVEIQTRTPDPRPAFWLNDVDGADFFRLRLPNTQSPNFALKNVKNFRQWGSQHLEDKAIQSTDNQKF